MDDLTSRGLEAMVVVDACVRKAVGEVFDMPKEEKEIIQKWLDKGVIEYTKKKINFSKEVYFPMLEHDCFKGFTIDFWQRVLIHHLNKYNTGSKLSDASASDYMSKAYNYNISPVVLKRSEASKDQKNQEQAFLEEHVWKRS